MMMMMVVPCDDGKIKAMMQVNGFARIGAKKIGLNLTMPPMLIENWIGRTIIIMIMRMLLLMAPMLDRNLDWQDEADKREVVMVMMMVVPCDDDKVKAMMQVNGFARIGAKKIGLNLTMAPMLIDAWIGRTIIIMMTRILLLTAPMLDRNLDWQDEADNRGVVMVVMPPLM